MEALHDKMVPESAFNSVFTSVPSKTAVNISQHRVLGRTMSLRYMIYSPQYKVWRCDIRIPAVSWIWFLHDLQSSMPRPTGSGLVHHFGRWHISDLWCSWPLYATGHALRGWLWKDLTTWSISVGHHKWKDCALKMTIVYWSGWLDEHSTLVWNTTKFVSQVKRSSPYAWKLFWQFPGFRRNCGKLLTFLVALNFTMGN